MSDQPASSGPAAGLQFDTAEHSHDGAPASLTCAACNRPIQTVYHQANGKTVCSACRAQIESARGSIGKALLWGAGGGVLGWAVYFGVSAIFNFEWSLIAILVGYLVGRGINTASAGRGGRIYQVMGVAITYFAIAAAYGSIGLLHAYREGTADAATVIGMALVTVILPFLVAMESPITVIIIGFGLYQAWISNRPAEFAFTGPHPVAPQAEPEAAALA